jgi:hypothetical protein
MERVLARAIELPHLSSEHQLLVGISLASIHASLFITNSIFYRKTYNTATPASTNIVTAPV